MITLFTSGSTKEPKELTFSYNQMRRHIERSVREIELTSSDVVLDVFPHNTIAHFTVTAMPALHAKSSYVSAVFSPYTYPSLIKKYQPSYIALVPRHYELLKNSKEWDSLDLSCVRYMVIGSGNVTQELIDDFRKRGVQTVANWYGMTEMPPPVLVGYNTVEFDFTPKSGYTIEFSDDGECIINGFATGDIFDVEKKIFLRRKEQSNGTTWKNNF